MMLSHQPVPHYTLPSTTGSGCANLEVKSQHLWHTKPSDNITMSPGLEISLLYRDSSSLIIPSYYYKGVTTHMIPFYWKWLVINNLLGCHVDTLWIQNASGKSVKSLNICFHSFVPNFIEHRDQLMPQNDLGSAWAKICIKVESQTELRKHA